MEAQSRVDGGSIPSPHVDVNPNRAEIVRIAKEIKSAWDRHQKADALAKMGIGDLMCSLPKAEAQLCRDVFVPIFGDGLYAKLKTIAWVAHRWSDLNARHKAIEAGRPFTWFRDNEPGGKPVPVRPYKVPFFQEDRSEYKPGDGWYIHGMASGDKEAMLRVSEDHFDTMMRGLGWEKVK